MFKEDRWGNRPLADAQREGHKHVASLLNSNMDQRANSAETISEFAHMEELRKWLRATGLPEGKGLHGLLETLDAEGIDTKELLAACWEQIMPMLKLGPATHLAVALGKRPALQQL